MRPVGSNNNQSNWTVDNEHVAENPPLPSLTEVVQELQRQGVQVFPQTIVPLLPPQYFQRPLQLPAQQSQAQPPLNDFMKTSISNSNRNAPASTTAHERLPSINARGELPDRRPTSITTYSQQDEPRDQHRLLPSISNLHLPSAMVNCEPEHPAVMLPDIHQQILDNPRATYPKVSTKRGGLGDLEEPPHKIRATHVPFEWTPLCEKPDMKGKQQPQTWTFHEEELSAHASSVKRPRRRPAPQAQIDPDSSIQMPEAAPTTTAAQADQHAFMATMKALPRLLKYPVKSSEAAKVLQSKTIFKEVCFEVSKLSNATAKSLLTIAEALVPGHKEASEVVATLWVTLGFTTMGPSKTVQDVRKLLRQDASGKLIWPAALGDDIAKACVNAWRNHLSHKTNRAIVTQFIALALELCGEKGE